VVSAGARRATDRLSGSRQENRCRARRPTIQSVPGSHLPRSRAKVAESWAIGVRWWEDKGPVTRSVIHRARPSCLRRCSCCFRSMPRGPLPVGLDRGGEGREEPLLTDGVGQAEQPQPGQQVLLDARAQHRRPAASSRPGWPADRHPRRPARAHLAPARSWTTLAVRPILNSLRRALPRLIARRPRSGTRGTSGPAGCDGTRVLWRAGTRRGARQMVKDFIDTTDFAVAELGDERADDQARDVLRRCHLAARSSAYRPGRSSSAAATSAASPGRCPGVMGGGWPYLCREGGRRDEC
jgi:hypothetical protein